MPYELNLHIPAESIKVTDTNGDEVPLRDLTVDQLGDLAAGFLQVLLHERDKARMH